MQRFLLLGTALLLLIAAAGVYLYTESPPAVPVETEPLPVRRQLTAEELRGRAASDEAANGYGKLHLILARPVIGTDCWIYVDGRIVAFREPDNDFYIHATENWTHVNREGKWVYGQPAKGSGKNVVWYTGPPDTRPPLSILSYDPPEFAPPDLFEWIDSIDVTAGTHTVEVATVSDRLSPPDRPPSPIRVVSRTEVTVEAGGRRAVLVNTLLRREFFAEDRPARAYDPNRTDAQRAAERARETGELKRKYAADPLVAALRAGPDVNGFIDLPPQYGGRRQYDRRQIDHMIGWLKRKYEVEE